MRGSGSGAVAPDYLLISATTTTTSTITSTASPMTTGTTQLFCLGARGSGTAPGGGAGPEGVAAGAAAIGLRSTPGGPCIIRVNSPGPEGAAAGAGGGAGGVNGASEGSGSPVEAGNAGAGGNAAGAGGGALANKPVASDGPELCAGPATGGGGGAGAAKSGAGVDGRPNCIVKSPGPWKGFDDGAVGGGAILPRSISSIGSGLAPSGLAKKLSNSLSLTLLVGMGEAAGGAGGGAGAGEPNN